MPRETHVGKEPTKFEACHQFASFDDTAGVHAVLREAWGYPGEYWFSSVNHRGDYRPIRLDLAQVRALHEATGLILADRESVQGSASTTTTNTTNATEAS